MPAKKPALGRGIDGLFGRKPGPGPAPPPAPAAPPVPASASTPSASPGDSAAAPASLPPTPETAPAVRPSSGAKTPSPEPSAGPREIPIGRIKPNPWQPRKEFDAEKLGELVDSIREKGVLQPVLLRAVGRDFQLIAGERRWRAAEKAGLSTLPAVIYELSDQEMMEAAIVENIQREDLGAVEEARAYEVLATEFKLTQEQIARKVGKSRVAVANSVRLLGLPDEILGMIGTAGISAGHARAILGVEGRGARIRLGREIVRRGWNVREAERQAKTWEKNERTEKSQKKASQSPSGEAIVDFEEKLTLQLGLKVRIKARGATSGKVEVSYESLDDFQRICEQFGLKPED